jgi:hypothetical protein
MDRKQNKALFLILVAKRLTRYFSYFYGSSEDLTTIIKIIYSRQPAVYN